MRKKKGRAAEKLATEARKPRLPVEGEVLGIVIQLLGHDRLRVKCVDGYTRLCRIPGRIRKRVWIREGDVVLVSPWDFQFETRGDVIWRYARGQAEQLKRRGLISF